MSLALEINQLSKRYASGVQALKDIDLKVEQGDFFALLGPNGAGKSTCIGIISSLVNKSGGSVKIFDHDLDRELSLAKQKVGLVPQEFNFNQFEKVELVQFVKPSESFEALERLRQDAEVILKKLDLPYRVVNLCGGDLSFSSTKTYDIEAWMAGQNAFREIVSCSNCLDYQARRLKIRFRDKTNEDTQYLHTLNSTLIATTRIMVSIMENFQTKDGHIRIPQVLQSYMGNQKEI